MLFESSQSPEKAAAVVARLESRLADEQAAHAAAKAVLGDAALAAETDGPGADAARQKARKAFDASAARLVDIGAALSAARQKHALALAAEARAQLANRWGTARRNGRAYVDAVRAYAAAATEAGAAYRRLKEAATAFATSLPPHPRPDLQEATLTTDAVRSVARKALCLGGVDWAWPLPVEGEPTAQLTQNAEALLALRPEVL